MDRLSLLVKAKETAEYFVDKKFKYSQNVANSWAGAKKKKVSNCVVCMLLLTAVRHPQTGATVLLQQEWNSCL